MHKPIKSPASIKFLQILMTCKGKKWKSLAVVSRVDVPEIDVEVVIIPRVVAPEIQLEG